MLCFFKAGSRQMPSTGWIGRAGPPHSPQFSPANASDISKMCRGKILTPTISRAKRNNTSRCTVDQIKCFPHSEHKLQISDNQQKVHQKGGANIKAGVKSKELSGTNANATFTVD